jgi:DNA-binding CsgD family transcriptional regulator
LRVIVGRDKERVRIDRLLADARAGRSGALVIAGEAGIGKSALLDYARSAAKDMRVIRGVGIETEAELPFGGLHLLLHPFIDGVDALPRPQATALLSAFGQSEAPVHNRFLVGVATLTLLAELAAERPLLCLVDDVQWLDQASSEALLFAARRLHADSIAMLFAVRETGQPFPTPGIEVLRLAGLPHEDATALLDRHAPGLTAPVRARVLEESGGNPLGLIELAAAFNAVERSGMPDVAQQIGPLQVTGRVQDAFRSQIVSLPDATRLLLVVAAADGTADIDAILGVAGSLGVSAANLEPAERVNLVALSDDRVAFRHPLIRAAAYQNAPHHQRMAVHLAFAQALTDAKDADRRAWHLAAATSHPDENVAAELERTAQRAQQRGGAMAVSAAYERAARLSTDTDAKAHRIAKAARAAYDAGRPDQTARLATEAASLTHEPAVVAEATFLNAQVAYERTSPEADVTLALEAAALIIHRDPERTVSMLTEAVGAGRDACAHDLIRQAVHHLQTLRLPPDSDLVPLVEAEIGWGHLFDGQVELAVAPMRSLVRAAREGTITSYLHRVIAGFSGLMIADDEASIAVMDSMLADARAEGALTWIPYAVEILVLGRLLCGQFRVAETELAEGASLAVDLGMDMQLIVLQAIGAWLAAVAGDADRCGSLAEGALQRSGEHPTIAAVAAWGLGLLDLADGRPDAALDRLDGVCSGPARHDVLIRAVPDQVEAAVRSGQADRGYDHLAAFDHWARSTGRPLPTALSHRCHALVGTEAEAEGHYAAALAIYEAHWAPYDNARTRLVYGEWLRRRRRRADARVQLVQAMDTFERLGASRWAERARAELRVLGERPVAKVHDVDVLKRLTPQELQVVRLAAGGSSNREIAARLFLSPRTVGHHLYKAYPKLGVSRRVELAKLEF